MFLVRINTTHPASVTAVTLMSAAGSEHSATADGVFLERLMVILVVMERKPHLMVGFHYNVSYCDR